MAGHTVAETQSPSSEAATRGESLHHEPPVRPRSLGRWPVALVIAAAFVAYAVAAGHSDGDVLRHVDDPIVSAVEDVRTGWMTGLMETVSHLGGNTFVFPAGAVMAVAAWRRCRPTAVTIVVVIACRPGVEWFVKELTDRQRPEDALKETTGGSFPSGHVLAALLLWALVPALVGCFTNRRGVWWTAVAVSSVFIGAVAASRIYLGVHWPTDVIASFVLGLLLLYVADRASSRLHRHLGCHRPPPSAA